MVFVVVVCGSLTGAFTIPKYDNTCLPPKATLVNDFQPGQLFDGKNLYVIAAPPPPSDTRLTCAFFNGTYDATSKSVNFTQNMIADGYPASDTELLTKDVDM